MFVSQHVFNLEIYIIPEMTSAIPMQCISNNWIFIRFSSYSRNNIRFGIIIWIYNPYYCTYIAFMAPIFPCTSCTLWKLIQFLLIPGNSPKHFRIFEIPKNYFIFGCSWPLVIHWNLFVFFITKFQDIFCGIQPLLRIFWVF